jgi:hypothetical protein
MFGATVRRNQPTVLPAAVVAPCGDVRLTLPIVRTSPDPVSSIDVLSDVLRAIRLTGAVYFDFELSSPWVREAPPARDLAGIVMPGAQRIIEYHVVAQGRCWAQIVGQPPIALEEGDVVMFPQGDAHVLASTAGMRECPDLAAFPPPAAALPVFYEIGGGGPERNRIICCFLGCDERPYNPLLDALPPRHSPLRGRSRVPGPVARQPDGHGGH